MYYEAQRVVSIVRDAATLRAGALAPAAAMALLERLPDRLRSLVDRVDLRDAPDDLAHALRTGEAAGPNAQHWLPAALVWLQNVVSRG